MHQLPTSNLLRELSEVGGVKVTCVVGQVSRLPSHVRLGLSAAMRRAVEEAVEMIIREVRQNPDRSDLSAQEASPFRRH
jgi:Ni,Fe-hydrogenase maturation factor